MIVRPFWYPPILTYHRVHPNPATDTPTLHPDIFDRQMARLARHWQPVDLATLVACLEGQGRLPARAVVVTFDDGTEDTWSHALPILTRHRIPATVFMIADNVGRPGSLIRDQLRAMHAGGITVGSHTVYHAYLPSRDPAQVRRELADSKRFLEDLLKTPVEFLSYPGGGYTPDVRRMARDVGYRAACTTNRGTQRWTIDPWTLRRITMHASGTSVTGLWWHCNGYYNALRRLRPPA